MRVLITNDDGIDAEGLAALRSVAGEFFSDIWVVAPHQEASQVGHRVTTYEPIRWEQREPQVFAVEGSPADCTRVALFHFLPEKPDWIWSGINRGGNLGRHDFAISGTMAAVREGAFFGIKGMAASQYLRKGAEPDWRESERLVAKAFRELREQSLEPGEFWSVNLPHPEPGDREPSVVFCPQEKAPLQVAYERVQGENSLRYTGVYQDRPGEPGHDVAVCFGGDVAVSRAAL